MIGRRKVRCTEGHWNSPGVAHCLFPECNAEITEEEKEMDERRIPKVYTPILALVCPDCLEETLSYSEDQQLFVCSEPKCGKHYALAEYGAG